MGATGIMTRATKHKCNVGDVIHGWRVTELPDRATASHRDRQYVKADCPKCGQEKRVSIYNLSLGKTHGCSECHFNDGTTKHKKLHAAWRNMRNRCRNPNATCFATYGGRGITVCDEWQSFKVFRDWAMQNGYDESLQIDRIDTNGNYEPNNCRWVTCKVNNNNRRSNVFVEAFGETKTISEWASDDRAVPNQLTLAARIRRGWDAESAITKPLVFRG